MGGAASVMGDVLAVPQWAQDLGVWLGIFGAFFGVVASAYAFSLWVFRRLRSIVEDVIENTAPEVVEPMIDRKLAPVLEAQDVVATQMATMANAHGEMATSLREVQRELRTNGGTSLRDRVNAISDAIGLPPHTHDPASPL